MRGIGRTFSRLPAARVLLAGAAILAVTTAQKAYAEPQGSFSPTDADDTALANPRISPHGPWGVALPRPLSPSEAARIRRIFADQARGDIPAALQESAQLDTGTALGRSMLGTILADRYLGRFTRPNAATLRDWMAHYSELPDAPAIHALLLVRLPRGAKPPPAPHAPSLSREETISVPIPEETEPAGAAVKRNRRLERAVHAAARAGHVKAALRLIERARGLAPGYAALLRGEAARILFTANRDADAYKIGTHDCPPCTEAALPAYVAGLAAWRMGRPRLAQKQFEAAWRAKLTTPALQAGAAYWAARTHLRTEDFRQYLPWLRRAAAQRSTFYGLIARRGLGLSIGAAPGAGEILGEADVDAVSATPEGRRAFALLQVGQADRAEAELRRLWPQVQGNAALGRAIMLVASRAGLANLAAQLADLMQGADGQPRDAARFAVPRLHPLGGFSVDPAMIYALARTESNFDANLVSSAGASGLLQIMPATARFIVGGGIHGTLHDPAVNLDLGQRYVAYLATREADLIRLLASYNSGPGNFSHWGPTIRDDGDPLLFIEAIPIDETRAFVPRVLSYTWLYAARLQLPTPSLDELAEGEWPRYHAPGGTTARLH